MAVNFATITDVSSFYEGNIFPKWLEYYKTYYGDMRDRQPYIKQRQANEPSKILARIVDTFRSRIYDNQFRFYVSPNNPNDVEKAQLVQDLLTWAIQVSNLRKKFFMSAKDALITGEGYGRIKYTIQNTKVEYINPKKGKKSYYMKKLEYPDYTYIAPFNMLIDPTAQSFEETRYIIARRLLTDQQIKNEYSYLFDINVLAKVKDDTRYLYSQDWLLLKQDALYQTAITDPNDNSITFDKNQYNEVVEYWEDNKLIIFINGHKVYEGDNPLPIKKKPFTQITFIQEPGTPRGIGLGHILTHIDKEATAVKNAFLDDLKLKSTPVYKKRIGLNLHDDENLVEEIAPGDVIPVEDINDLMVMELGRLNYDIQNIYNWLLQEAMMEAGVNDIVMGGPLMKVDRSATSSASRVEAFKARTLTFFDSINRALGQIAEMWLAMVIAYNEGDEFTFKVFDDETKQTIFKTIKLEDIEGQFDIIFDTQALKSALRDIALQKKMNFLQVAAQLAVDPITQQPIIDLKKLVENIAYDMDLPDIVVDNQKQENTEQAAELVMQQLQKQSQQQQPKSQQPIQQQEQLPTEQNEIQLQKEMGEESGLPPTEGAQQAKELLEEALNPNM